MKTEKIVIANLKCSGCENTIKSKLMSIKGVESVAVDHDTDSVIVTCSDITKRQALSKTLHNLGYPEATEANGLLLQLKSYASCMVGRLQNIKTKAAV